MNNELQGLLGLLASNAQFSQQQTMPQTVRVGDTDLLVKQGGNFANRLNNVMPQFASNLLALDQNRKRDEFMLRVKGVAQSPDNPDQKIDQLIGLMAEHGTDYGLGLQDIVAEYGKQSRSKSLWVDNLQIPEGMEVVGYDQEGRPMIRKKKDDGVLSPSRQNAKDARVETFIGTVEQNNIKRQMVSEATKAAQNITGGIYGKVQRGMLRSLDPNNPILGDWQKVKMVLTDAQLMNTAKTKGAISDREMELFSRAAANDDVASLPAIKPALKKVFDMINADERSLAKSFNKMYGEDPYSWTEVESNIDQIDLSQVLGGQETPQNSDKVRSEYNALRARGMSAQEAKKRLGL